MARWIRLVTVRAVDRVSGTYKLEKLEVDLAKKREEKRSTGRHDSFREEMRV